MYNHKLISDFIEKVNKEAEAAAQKVFDRYQPEFEKRVLSQMRNGDYLYIAMGSASFKGNETIAMEKFSNEVAKIQYTEQRAGFGTGDLQKPIQ